MQIASSTDGGYTWGTFSTDLTFGGYPLAPSDSVYFFAVRALQPPPTLLDVPAGRSIELKETTGAAGAASGGSSVLMALFPGVIDGSGGVYCSMSLNGRRWTRPRRVLASQVEHTVRTREFGYTGAPTQD